MSDDPTNPTTVRLPSISRLERLDHAVKEIARQLLPCEMDPDDLEAADYVGAYEAMILVARSALL